jgi:hypothetical protein
MMQTTALKNNKLGNHINGNCNNIGSAEENK